MIELKVESGDQSARTWVLSIDGYEVSEVRRPGRWRVESGLSPGQHTIFFGVRDSTSLYKCYMTIGGKSLAFILNEKKGEEEYEALVKIT